MLTPPARIRRATRRGSFRPTVVLAVMVWQRDKLRTEVVVRHADAPQGSDLAFMKLPVVWWCFGFFLLSTMTLAVVSFFRVSNFGWIYHLSVA